MQKKGHGILKGIWTLLTLGLVLLLFSPSQAWALNVYVMGGGDAPSDTGVINALQERGHVVTQGVETPDWDGTQANLNDFDVVVLLYNSNWTRSLTPAGIATTRDYIANGGAVVTGEWFIWGVFAAQADDLAPLMPVSEYCGWNFGPSTTYTRVTADPIINNGLPQSFTFPLSSFSGTESCFREQVGATVFYSSSNGGGQPGAAGLVGWDVEKGRVASFSTLLGGNGVDER